MGRLGLYPALIIVVFGVVAPFFIFKLGRFIGFAPLLALAFAAWHWLRRGEGGIPLVWERTLGNVAFMAASALILVAYAAVSYSAGALIDKTMSSLRRD